MNESGIAEQKEPTVTEAQQPGTCVPTNLDVEVGRVLRIRSVTDHVSLFAAIRLVIAPDGIAVSGWSSLADAGRCTKTNNPNNFLRPRPGTCHGLFVFGWQDEQCYHC
jgi:hypothetical protein